MEIREYEDFVNVFVSGWRYEIPREDYDILKRVARKYSVPIKALLEIMIKEGQAVKVGRKRGLKKDLTKIINRYYNKART